MDYLPKWFPKNRRSITRALGSVETDPDILNNEGELNETAMLSHGDILLKNGETGLARRLFQTLILSDYKSAEAYLGLGRSFEQEGDMEAAEGLYEAALKNCPETNVSREVLYRLSGIRIQNGRDEEALEALNTLKKSLPDNFVDEEIKLHLTIGRTLLRLGNTEEASKMFTRALEISKDHSPIQAECYLHLGKLCINTEDIEQARRFFETSINIYPNMAESHTLLGECHLKKGHPLEALHELEMALNLKLRQPHALSLMVKVCRSLNRIGTARGWFERYEKVYGTSRAVEAMKQVMDVFEEFPPLNPSEQID